MTTEFAPSIIIGVDVSTPDSVTANPDMITQLSEMITQPGRGKLTPEQGIYIHINLSQFGLLDFAKADKISAIGYARAMEAMDSIKGRITARIPAMARNLRRDMFKSQTPYLRFDSITVTGASKSKTIIYAHISRIFILILSEWLRRLHRITDWQPPASSVPLILQPCTMTAPVCSD